MSQSLAVQPPAVATQPAVSVCIANWNCRELLRQCLRSLFDNPQGVPFEVIVADNGSADGAPEMVAAEFPQVTLVRNAANLGFSRANNQAAAVAAGRYLFFLNNDTLVPAYALRRLLAFAEEHPDVGMIGPRLRGADGRNQISYRRRPTVGALLHKVSLLRWTGLFRRAYREYRRDTYTPHGVRRVEALMGAAVLLPRPAFDRAGRWDEGYRFGGEDLDLSAQVNRTAAVVYVGSVEIVHYGRQASRANAGYVAPNVAVGYVHYLRRAGVRPAVLRAYKLLVTLDAPVQLAGELVGWAARRVRGDAAKAARSRRAAAGRWRFLTRELRRFWAA